MSTSHICVNELPGVQATNTSPANTLKRYMHYVACTLKEWNRRKTGRIQLLVLDEHMLRDIGISRADAEFEARKPFWKE